MRRKITHTFFIHKTFGKYFSKTIHKQVIKCRKLVPLKHLHVYNNIIKYETEHKERVHALRMTFHPNSIKAFIIPSTDPHLSEYVAPHWMSREWISGFTGSAGTAVILMDKAGLWTDSRYFLQATKELEGSGITLYKEMLPETPSITEFLCQHLKPGESASIDGKMFSVQQVEQMKEELAAHQLQVDIFGDPLSSIWKDRPAMPDSPAFIYDIKYAGKSCEEKISAIRTELKRKVSMLYSYPHSTRSHGLSICEETMYIAIRS